MNLSIRNLVPMAFVKSVPRSIAFYEKFGFRVLNTHTPEGAAEPVWAWLASGRAALMIALAEEPIIPEKQGFLFYLYADDVAAFRTQLLASGVTADEICYPFYSPKGEFRVTDPDGYTLIISHD